jgi:hypothetical protein
MRNGFLDGTARCRSSAAVRCVRNSGIFGNYNVQKTDGPYAETKEQIGGILILEAESLEHAVELMARHPGVRVGPFEIRPADEKVNAMIFEKNRQFLAKVESPGCTVRP